MEFDSWSWIRRGARCWVGDGLIEAEGAELAIQPGKSGV
jgi:hypothetical protein